MRTTPEFVLPLQISAPHQWKVVWTTTSDLTFPKPTYTANLQWNQVSNLEPSGAEAETYHQTSATQCSGQIGKQFFAVSRRKG
ncbi:hypothetical protein AVEN_1650-1 [Araneus ventricosus]|uniref:Uncharacterized protein n=1 Tax=Araneus ventricosus TaxID=182803 RepID=A0A4Y2RPR0_ARAVE|nr:hypothetical protein AVEN_1650-1 [Araneus ventricosus]